MGITHSRKGFSTGLVSLDYCIEELMLTLPGVAVSIDEGGSKQKVQVLSNPGNWYSTCRRKIKAKKHFTTEARISSLTSYVHDPCLFLNHYFSGLRV